MQNLQCTSSQNSIELEPDASIVIIGNNLESRMMHIRYFEIELHSMYPDHNLLIPKQSIPGTTPVFRPHSSRNEPWAFSGADSFNVEFTRNTGNQGHYHTPNEWISK